MVNIYLRFKTTEGWERRRVGQGKPPAGARYQIRFTDANGKRRWSGTFNTLKDAQESASGLDAALVAASEGLTVPEFQNMTNAGKTGLEERIDTFLAETLANKARKTWLAYQNSMTYFKASCKKPFVENIVRTDMLAFKTHLRKENLSDRSVYNNFLNTMVFLKWCNMKAGVKAGDWPSKPERPAEEYHDEELETLLKTANPLERLVLNSFLCSGVRSAELAHLTYGDINFKRSTWTIRPKEGWQTKTEASQRDVPVATWLTGKIEQRRTATQAKNTDLLFPNKANKPNGHLIRIVKRVAIRAGLLKIVKREDGKKVEVGIRVDDHKFRSTAITRWLRDGVAPHDVMYWVGHRDLATILRYSAKLNVQKAAAKSGQAFQQFEAVGD